MVKKMSVGESAETKVREVSSLEVGDVMSRGVISISADDTVASAAKTMSENKVSCIVVLDDGDLVGIVTERDFLKRLGGGGKDFAIRKVAEVMSSPVESVCSSLPVFEASELMGEKGIKRLPVVEEGRLFGMVTQTDLLRASASYGMWRNVSEVMSSNVAVIEKGASVAEAAEVMTSRGISCIVVTEGDEVVGVMTEKDPLRERSCRSGEGRRGGQSGGGDEHTCDECVWRLFDIQRELDYGADGYPAISCY
jgi:CBS domain-containing protein